MKEDIYLLQVVDCNCNDCKYMVRDMAAYSKWEQWNRQIQEDEFNKKKAAALEAARNAENNQAKQTLLHAAQRMKFMFDRSNLLQYGHCAALNKPVSFIPNTCQIDTQDCFKHRRL